MHPSGGRMRLRNLLNARRHIVFDCNHVRIAHSIFSRPCSCTATLAEEVNNSKTSKSLNKPTNDASRPPADHRQLGVAQELFATSIYSPGSPLLLPNGSDMFLKLASCLRSLYPQFGFREVITPTIYKKALWERSGHWQNYADDMFEVRGRGASGQKMDSEIDEDELFGLKPMNCPGHCLLFASKRRSYREMPIRYADFGTLHRNEISGALSGLTRVRRFHQDDGHIFCRPSQIEDEIKKTMGFIQLIYEKIFDLGPYRLVLSTRPHANYIGTQEEWDSAEAQLKAALDHSGRDWTMNEGDGAFYGPKIDIILKDSDGKEHQTATIQLDFQLPQRFNLTYQAPAPEFERKGTANGADPEALSQTGPVTPVIIHRAILGSLERFMALLIEHYNGRYPFWISPRPVTILTVSDEEEVLRYAEAVRKMIDENPFFPGDAADGDFSISSQMPIHTEVDNSRDTISKKVKMAKMKGYNFLLVIGQKEVRSQTVHMEMHNQHARDREAYEKLIPYIDQVESGNGSSGFVRVNDLKGFFINLQKRYM